MLLTIISGFIAAEVIGYFLHRLLHSDKVRFLSRSHMQHHLKDYGPTDPMRQDSYLSGARGRMNVLGLGLEWLVPSAILIAIIMVLASLLGFDMMTQVVFLGSIVGWCIVMFNYMHDAMHKKDFWLFNVPVLGSLFKRSRRSHDIHHQKISDKGLLDTNFGICFFFLDMIFGTFHKDDVPMNEEGFSAALERYKHIID